jgi:hypothetical protein
MKKRMKNVIFFV